MAHRSPAGRPGEWARTFPVVSVILLLFILILLSWTGYTESDDRAYAEAATAWMENFPHLGTDHHALRHAIVLPTALFFWVFGRSEIGLVLPILIYLVATLTVTFMAVSAVAGRSAGLLALLLTGTMPALVLGATLSFTDIPETFFIVASVWSFFFACRDRRVGLFLLSGAMAGLGFVTRETSVAILVLYGILFVRGYGGYRLGYIWMGVGFVLSAGLDFGALWAASGDPFYRFHVSLMGVEADSPLMQDRFKTTPGVDRFGALAVSRGLKPFVIAFLNQQFGLLFWFAVPAAIVAARRGPSAARLLGGAAAVWFAVLFYAMADYLNVIARYIDVAAVAIAVPLAIWLARHWQRRWAKASVAAIVAVNCLAIAGADTQPLFGEKAVAVFARDRNELISTDPGTFQGAALLLEWEGLMGRVLRQPPSIGALYAFDSRPRRGIPAGWPVQRPGPGWQELARQDKPVNPLAYVARALGVRRYLPSGIADKLDPPAHFVALYRVR